MRLDGSANLCAPQVGFGTVIDAGTQPNLQAVEEPHVAWLCIDACRGIGIAVGVGTGVGPGATAITGRHDASRGNRISVAVGLEFTRLRIEIVALAESLDGLRHCAGGAHPLEFDACLRGAVGLHVNAQQTNIAIRATHALQLDAMHFDALDQAQVVGVHCIKVIDGHVFGAVRGGVTDREQRLELIDACLRRLAAHLLRFIKNHDGMRVCNHLDGLA